MSDALYLSRVEETLSLRPFCSLRQFFEPHLLCRADRRLTL